jgi:hypothetical protein
MSTRRRAAFAILAVVLPWGSTPADEIQTSSIGVPIPQLATLQISGDVSGLLSLAGDGSGESTFDAGAIESAADATELTLSTNDTWDLSVKRNGDWTSPAGYDKAESDLLIRIANSPTGTIQNGAEAYLSPATTDTEILSHGSAVADDVVQIQTKVLLDWTRDVPGVYDVSLTYTLVTHLP